LTIDYYIFRFVIINNVFISVPPEELYATQLTQLREMGFIDNAENIQALVATAGNVHAAVERLLGNLGQ
jgi:ubiquilin